MAPPHGGWIDMCFKIGNDRLVILFTGFWFCPCFGFFVRLHISLYLTSIAISLTAILLVINLSVFLSPFQGQVILFQIPRSWEAHLGNLYLYSNQRLVFWHGFFGIERLSFRLLRNSWSGSSPDWVLHMGFWCWVPFVFNDICLW